jgi:hypothetical protein
MFDATNRHGIIAELARRTNQRGFNLGKTALQKHVYFLQTLHDVNSGYDFRLYTYGPFSAQILSDLDTVEFIDGVTIGYDSSVSGYRIRPGNNVDNVTESASDFLEHASDAIDEVLDDFGSLSAKDLELRATIVYAEREARDEGRTLELKELAETVHSIKPHFPMAVVLAAVKELQGKQHIELQD